MKTVDMIRACLKRFDDDEGIVLEIPLLGTGASIRFYLLDDAAQDMINIIQNKLNARL